MTKSRRYVLAGVAAGLLGGSLQSTARADEIADFYRGKIITMVVGTPGGGGYDIYARLLTRFMGKYIPGNPTFIVQNRPGAGGITATNYVYNVAPQDGTILLAPTRTVAFSQLLGQPGPAYDATKINWLGSLNNEVGVIEVVNSSAVKTFQDARKMSATIGSSSAAGDGEIYPSLMNNTLNTKFKLVQGYKGSNEVDLAIERGEVEGQSDSFSAMQKHFPDWRKKLNILAQLSLTKHPDLPDIPLILDFITPEFVKPGLKVEEVDTLWRIMLVQKAMGRPFAVGPNVPPARVAALRAAFHAVEKDPEFLAEAEKTNNEVNAVDGSEIQAMVEKISKAPQSVIDKLNDAIAYKD
jgi:tripartite-type tricarboxylate transporter receptor subunit TctC